MKEPPTPDNERQRITTLHALRILHTPKEEHFDRITRVATKALNLPIAAISLIDTNQQWFKSIQGLNTESTPRSISFCGHAILQNKIFVIEDAQKDKRFTDNPLVTKEPHIRFYAGVPLASIKGHNLGTLCVIGKQPRTLTLDEQMILKDLAYWAQREIQQYELSNENLSRSMRMLKLQTKIESLLTTYDEHNHKENEQVQEAFNELRDYI